MLRSPPRRGPLATTFTDLGRRALALVRRMTSRLVGWVTTALLHVGLFLAYFLAMPLTRLLSPLASRGPSAARRRDRPSHWQEARDFSSAEADVLDPS